MFKEQMNKFKSFIEKNTGSANNGENKPNKRKIENMVVFLIILIVTLITINSILSKDKEKPKEEETSSYKTLADVKMKNNEEYDDALEERLENILETMARNSAK